jgi:peptide deformylase
VAVLPVKRFPDPVLRRKALKVNTIDASIQRLIDDMVETMYDAGGVGLAAPQVGISLRVIVLGIPDEEPFAIINPQIVKKEGERVVTEGCLSIPGYRGELKRAEQVKVRGLDRNGKELRMKAEGLLAQALEHEIDHLDGVLYIDLLESPDKLVKVQPEEETSEVAPEPVGAARG